jgi:SAM-dependent methyltransferase
MDITEIIKFYQSRTGQIVKDELTTHISQALSQNVTSHLFIGAPFALIKNDAPGNIYFMDRNIGATIFPSKNHNKVALIDLEQIPLDDQSISQITIVHCLEYASSPLKFMRELWRILAPEGTLRIITPNRRSIWSHLDISPFGHGNPYSMSQLSTLAKESQFDIIKKDRSLFTPPYQAWVPQLITQSQSYLIKNFTPKLSGVIVMDLRKRVYCSALPKDRKRLATSEPATRARISSFDERG